MTGHDGGSIYDMAYPLMVAGLEPLLADVMEHLGTCDEQCAALATFRSMLQHGHGQWTVDKALVLAAVAVTEWAKERRAHRGDA